MPLPALGIPCTLATCAAQAVTSALGWALTAHLTTVRGWKGEGSAVLFITGWTVK